LEKTRSKLERRRKNKQGVQATPQVVKKETALSGKQLRKSKQIELERRRGKDEEALGITKTQQKKTGREKRAIWANVITKARKRGVTFRLGERGGRKKRFFV